MDSFQGWQAYARHANAFELRKKIYRNMQKAFPSGVSSAEVNELLKMIK